MSESEQRQILEKLDIIIKLLAVDILKGKEAKDQILTLHRLDISPTDIASILGKTRNTVNVTLSQARRQHE